MISGAKGLGGKAGFAGAEATLVEEVLAWVVLLPSPVLAVVEAEPSARRKGSGTTSSGRAAAGVGLPA